MLKVGHSQVESAIGTAHEVRVANALLFGQRVARHHRIAAVDIDKRTSVATHGEINIVPMFQEIDHQVSHIAAINSWRCTQRE